MLCDFAQVSGNKLFISGANIDRVSVPAGTAGPFPISLTVAGLIRVPWDATNVAHTCTIALRDEDGRPALAPGEPPTPMSGEFGFTVGRPALLAAGETQNVPFAVNFAGLPLPGRGRFGFEVSIDGVPVRTVTFAVD